jgi:hypothetical protein
MEEGQIHTLEFLLAFDGRLHWYEQGYCTKFEIKRTDPTTERPHGLRYSFTLHDPDGKRLMGFDNAHTVAARGRNAKRPAEADHWHRTEDDPGRPYVFSDSATLIADFFDEVERILTGRGVSMNVVKEGLKSERMKP